MKRHPEAKTKLLTGQRGRGDSNPKRRRKTKVFLENLADELPWWEEFVSEGLEFWEIVTPSRFKSPRGFAFPRGPEVDLKQYRPVLEPPEIVAKVGKSGWQLPQPLPSKLALQEFRENLDFVGRSQTTITTYTSCVGRFLEGHEEVPADYRVVRGFLAQFKGRNTRNTYYLILASFYSFLEREHGLPNPMPKVGKPGLDKTLPDHLNPEQREQLLSAPLSPRDEAMLRLLAETGVRPGEIAGQHGHPLRFCDIYSEYMEVSGKTGERIVPVSPEMRDRLKQLREGGPSDSPIFRNRGNALTTWGIRKLVKRAFSAAGIRGVRPCPYTLRHSFGGEFLSRGGDVAFLQKILGHRDIKTTMVYTHIADRAVLDAYRRYSPGANNTELFALPKGANPSELLPQLLDQLEELGEAARRLKETLGGNGHRAEKLQELQELLGRQASK